MRILFSTMELIRYIFYHFDCLFYNGVKFPKTLCYFMFLYQEETKLYIFLELVTQGSLASLYQKYHLRETHVSAYTRQILHGLVYLHERNIVHRLEN
jgi:serine/threonine protein kinase